MSTEREDDDWEIRVSTLGFLANNLRGYEPTSILREQLQNADDASHKQGRSGELHLAFLKDRLVVTNPSVFSPVDWQRLREPNSRGKILDAEQTGEFGVGFWGSLHLTDAPVVTSGDLEVTFRPPRISRRGVEPLDATRIDFLYRRNASELSKELEAAVITPEVEAQMADTFVSQMAELLLFTRAIETIVIDLPDGSRRRATRTVEPVSATVHRLNVRVEGAPTDDCSYLTVRTELSDPPAGRHGRVTVALPLTPQHRGPGRAFFMFPTETDSGLHLSVDAHFRATDDRRSLENSGVHGAWNDRIFEAAGTSVGRALEVVLDPAVHGLDSEDAIAWFTDAGSQLPDIARRARLFTKRLDAEACERAVVPDRAGQLRMGSDLVDLPSEIEPILGDAVGDSSKPVHRNATRLVYRRWGLVTWGARETARWLAEHVPSTRAAKRDAPAFVQDAAAALALLDFCRGEERTLHGAALLLGTDDAYHPIGGPLARPSDDLQHLVTGLARPLVDRSFLNSWAAKLAPKTTAQWLRDALIESTDRLLDKRVPLSTIGAASKQQHVSEAIAAVRRTGHGLEGVPLALDEDSYLRVFDDRIVVGLPDANRKQATQLARRLGLSPLHKAIDDDEVKQAGQQFNVNLVSELIPTIDDWNPIADSRLLVEVLGTIGSEGTTPMALVERFRAMRIWQGSDGRPHALADLRLPAQHRIVRSSRPLIADELVGDANPSSPVFATFKGLLRVDVLDTTEEVVLSCEDPPASVADRRQLLIDLGDCDRLSKVQVQRLQRATFALCRDGELRGPGQVLLTAEDLPLGLGGRCVDDEAGRDRHVRDRLGELGSPDLPPAADLLDAATEISQLEISGDPTRDPGRVLWDHLVRCYDKYAQGALGELGSVAWLVTTPGPARRKPKDCYDPSLGFASMLFPVPAGVGNPPQAMRDALRMRSTLETDDCVKLADHAVESGDRLDRQFFQYINRRCDRGPADRRRIADLRSLPIVHLTTGRTKPEALVSRESAAIWRHLRALVPDQFVEDFPNLVDAWGIRITGEIDWHDHLEVLDEIARLEELEARDRSLAAERVDSIAAFSFDDHQVETLRRRLHLLTSLGLRQCGEVLRNDLPPAVVERLAPLLPIVEESTDTADLYDQLGLRSLREAVTLDPLIDGVHEDGRWPEILRRHAVNVLRFLKAAGTHLDRALLEAWPPIVKGVRSLSVRASIDGRVLGEWEAEAHLADEGTGLTLYVSGAQLSTQAVVDAISSEFGIDRGRKSLLLLVLEASTASKGAERLEWDNIPALTEREAAFLFEHEESEVVFSDSAGLAEHDETREAAVHFGDNPPPVLANDIDLRSDEAIGSIDVAEAPTPEPDVEPSEIHSEPHDDDFAVPDEPDWGDHESLRSTKGTTDFEALEDQGIVVRRDLDEEPVEEAYQPEPNDDDDEPLRDELRVCLSFFDVSRGVLPIESKQLNRLTSNVALREVELFGETIPARSAGPRHVQIENGASIFHSRQVVAGTVVRIHPSVPGRLEIEVRPDLHHVDGVWMLELDEHGRLERLRQDDIELQWETDDRFYRAERRLEDIEALMMDGGKSAVQLIIEVFLRRPGEGLTADEIWDLVAISRLFADATIRQTLSSQSGLFEKRDGLWYQIGNELRVARGGKRSSGAAPPATSTSSRSAPLSDAIKIARKLAQLLTDADEATLNSVVQLLGIRSLLEDVAFTKSCDQYVASPDPVLLDALERELRSDPGRAIVAVRRLEACTTPILETARPLLDLVCLVGGAAAVARARALLVRLDAVAGNLDGDPAEVAAQMVVALEDGTAGAAEVWEWVARMWGRREHGDPLTNPAAWLRDLAAMENLHRRASRLSEPTEQAAGARSGVIGWLRAQLPAEVYAEAETQRLRVVLDLLAGRPSETVLDGLHQLGLLAAQVPGADGDAALLYALVGAHARQAAVNSPIVERSRKEVEKLKSSIASEAATRFVEMWAELAHLPLGDVFRSL